MLLRRDACRISALSQSCILSHTFTQKTVFFRAFDRQALSRRTLTSDSGEGEGPVLLDERLSAASLHWQLHRMPVAYLNNYLLKEGHTYIHPKNRDP